MEKLRNLPKAAKIIVAVVVSVFIVAALAVVTIMLLKAIVPQKDDGASASSSIEQLRTKATAAENTGNTDAAIDYYNQLLTSYKDTNDMNGVAGATAKIAQLKSIAASAKQEATQEKNDEKARADAAGAPIDVNP
ncbi:MAG: hypothetical protein ABJA64_01915 [Candidatus Saccharibacteria bacterium]